MPPALGHPPPADRESFWRSMTMVDKKLGRECGTWREGVRKMAAQVEQARKALASAEQKPRRQRECFGRSKKPFPQDPAVTFCSFPSGCPLHNDAFAVQDAVPAAAASSKDASGNVPWAEPTECCRIAR